MLYIDSNSGKVISSEQAKERGYADTMTRHDWKSYDVAAAVAYDVSNAEHALYIAIDCGPGVYPRYDIIKAPAVGDDVSYTFNGDYYPDGKIASISESLRIVVTDTGNKYYRHKLTGAWKRHKTWTLVRGHITERNPHF